MDNVWAMQELSVCNTVIQLIQLKLGLNAAFIMCMRLYAHSEVVLCDTWT